MYNHISIHAPRGGGSDLFCSVRVAPISLFQSTLPVGGATASNDNEVSILPFQSTLPVGGATIHDNPELLEDAISIHAPRGGSDKHWKEFCGENTISIHAPRGGSDLIVLHILRRQIHFNPRSPWGERLFQFQRNYV